MNADVHDWVCKCTPCQRAEVHRYPLPPTGKFLQPDHRSDIVHINIVRRLPPCDVFRYLLTAVDSFTCWPETTPLPDSSAAMVTTWVVHLSQHGLHVSDALTK